MLRVEVDALGASEHLDATSIRIIQEEQRDPIVASKIARADVLAIATEIDETQGLRTQHAHEPDGPATVRDFVGRSRPSTVTTALVTFKAPAAGSVPAGAVAVSFSTVMGCVFS